MTAFEVRRTINASPDAVWAHLTDAATLQDGGLGIRRLDGVIEHGASIAVTSEANPGRAFTLRVDELSPPRRMIWKGGMPLGLFTGVRTFTLTAVGPGTEFHMREEFSGLLAPLITKSIPDLQPSFEQFADGLRRLAEGGAR